MPETTRLMCTPQTRTLATIGGNLCHAAPSADFAPALIALDADVLLFGDSGQRRLPISDFFEHVKRTAIHGPELRPGQAVGKDIIRAVLSAAKERR